MFEFEMSDRRRHVDDIPAEVASAFREHDVTYPAASLHLWEEHCTECAFPACYATCDLYDPRRDGNCRRFAEGAVRIDGLTSNGAPVVEIAFKRWANMYSRGPVTLLGHDAMVAAERRTERTAGLLAAVPDRRLRLRGWPSPASRLSRRLRAGLRRKATETSGLPGLRPDLFVMVIHVPGETGFDATLDITPDEGKVLRPFRKRLELGPGHHRVEIPVSEIEAAIGRVPGHYVSLIPNTEGGSADRIFLGFAGFVALGDRPVASEAPKSAKTVKVLVWDLDHTLWDGILVEDGVETLRLKPGVREVIETLDRRGIVNSVASKNDAEPALAAIEHFGLSEFFVFPQIGWNPKSRSLSAIVDDFNIGANTVAFIDDQPFERSEVESVHPEIRVYDAALYRELPDRPEFSPDVSSESASRRAHYVNEGARRSLATNYEASDYEAFLSDCDLRMTILAGGGQNVERIHELTQRTNQMNFSGTRYTRPDIEALLGDDAHDVYSLTCTDRFGEYGTVGFGLVRRENGEAPRLVDLAFSCRVQAKRAEHAFLAWLGGHYADEGAEALDVRYRPTPRNAATAKVFDDMGFLTVSGEGDETEKLMRISLTPPPPQSYPWIITAEDHA